MSAAGFRGRLAVLVATLFSVAVTAASAQSYPSKSIEFVVHTSPGGGTDLFARAMADILAREKLVSQSIQIMNRPGGGGTIAYNYIKTKRGDAHVVLTVATGSLLTASTRENLGLGLDNYTPIAFFAQDPQAVMVLADSKFKTFQDLVESAKREPNSLVAAVASAGGTARLALYYIEKETGTRNKFVAFKSGAEAITSVLGGHTHFTTENVSEAWASVESKKMRVLAVTTKQRLPQLPDVPTLTELGFRIHVGTGRGFAMPAGVPKEASAYWEGVLERAHKTQAWKDLAHKNLFEDFYLGSAEFGEFLIKRREDMQGFLVHIGVLKAQ
ncbi:MAG: tripartite tricarboxylate transporter substrate binding protein [Betaproteobacteria bacterium]|nr:tripartite tricarboxylate transporter substrate binding protein [Betaproteobacteria bacterium]